MTRAGRVEKGAEGENGASPWTRNAMFTVGDVFFAAGEGRNPPLEHELGTGIWLASGIRCLPSVDSCQPPAAPIFSTAGTRLGSKSLLLATEMHSSFRYGPRAIPLGKLAAVQPSSHPFEVQRRIRRAVEG